VDDWYKFSKNIETAQRKTFGLPEIGLKTQTIGILVISFFYPCCPDLITRQTTMVTVKNYFNNYNIPNNAKKANKMII
jgi:hypothetical protein